jgi:hypothetical protein
MGRPGRGDGPRRLVRRVMDGGPEGRLPQMKMDKKERALVLACQHARAYHH